MSGGAPKVKTPPPVAPSPTPIVGKEEEEAKKKVRARRGGRQSTILAGRMMAGRDNTNILKTKLG